MPLAWPKQLQQFDRKNMDALYVLFFQKKFKQNNLFGGQMEGYHIGRLKQNGLEKPSASKID